MNYEQPGWPRSRAFYKPKEYAPSALPHPRARFTGMLPVPWVIEAVRMAAGVEPDQVRWTVFHKNAGLAHDERLCQICGYKLGKIMILLATEGGLHYETSGPGLHPRC